MTDWLDNLSKISCFPLSSVTAPDLSYIGTMDLEFTGEQGRPFTSSCSSANFSGLFSGQTKHGPSGCAVPDFIGGVLRWRSPRKVFKAVISGVSIEMARLVPRWARTNKSGKNESVNVKRARRAIEAKSDLHVSPLFCVRSKDALTVRPSARSIAADPAFIADRVNTLVAGNLFPSLHLLNVDS